MTLLVTLKRISDSCFYLTFANLFVSLFNGVNLIVTLPVFVGVAFLSALLNMRGKVKYLALLLLPLCFCLVPVNLITLVALVPLFVYISFSLIRSPEFTSHFSYTATFDLFFKLVLPIIGIFIIFGVGEITLHFAILFVLCSITLMRMLRHDVEILNHPRFQVLNSLSLMALVTGSLIVSSTPFLNAARTGIYLLYFKIIVPFLKIIISVLVFFLRPLFLLLEHIIGEGFMSLPEAAVGSEIIEVVSGETTPSETAKIVMYMGATILLIFVIWKFIRMISLKTPQHHSQAELKEIRTSLPKDKKHKKVRWQPSNQIRQIYRKFLILCQKKGVEIKPFMTSLNIDQEISKHLKGKESKELREIYLKVRYNHFNYSKADLKRAKALYKKIYSEWNEKN